MVYLDSSAFVIHRLSRALHCFRDACVSPKEFAHSNAAMTDRARMVLLDKHRPSHATLAVLKAWYWPQGINDSSKLRSKPSVRVGT